MLQNPELNFHFSIIITQRCNLRCTYCHFYHTLGRTTPRGDIAPELFDTYIRFISLFRTEARGRVAYRFSGGDPIALGDKLFDLSKQAYHVTGLKPYVLTAGKGLNQRWVDKAKKADIDHLLVSIENPFDPDPGSINPREVLEVIRTLSSEDLPIFPGATIVRNNGFKDIYRMCKVIYDWIGLLPNIQELNYQPYESPTDQELQELYENVRRVVKEFWNKAPLNLFVYVSPEFAAVHDNRETYLLELSMQNPYHMEGDDLEPYIQPVLDKCSVNYPRSGCECWDCAWHSGCRNLKWLWKVASDHVDPSQKLIDYCRFKKTINAAFYDALFPESPLDRSNCQIYQPAVNAQAPVPQT